MKTSSSTSPGLYIHVPFCAAKCCYCDFYSVTDRRAIGQWRAALRLEMSHYRGRFGMFDTVYVGGGTPSVLDAQTLAAIMEAVRENFSVSPGAEITIEANPQDVTPATARALFALGFNRISLGMQSFDDRVLRFLARRHTADQCRAAFTAARAAGFDNIGIDLMYGVPGQPLGGWMRTLAAAVALAPEHISCYQLTVKDGTPLAAHAGSRAFQALDDERARAFFSRTARFLQQSGYDHYEVSNFARHETLRSRHNQKYWHHVNYLGLGPAAHSFQDGRRWWNCASVDAYITALHDGRAPLAGSETLSAGQLRAETLFLGFRTRRGIALDFFTSCGAAAAALGSLSAERLVRIEHGRVMPTTRGMLVADSIPRLFL